MTARKGEQITYDDLIQLSDGNLKAVGVYALTRIAEALQPEPPQPPMDREGAHLRAREASRQIQNLIDECFIIVDSEKRRSSIAHRRFRRDELESIIQRSIGLVLKAYGHE